MTLRRGVPIAIIVFVILLSVALLLPLVQKVRESGHPHANANLNLKQCAMAVHAFHDTHKRLPDGFGPVDGKRLSLWFQLLPYVNAEDVYKSRSANVTVLAYTAASDMSSRDEPGVLSFAGNIRIFAHQTLLDEKQPVDTPHAAVQAPEGTMIANLTLAQITDGTQNTFLMMTRYSLCGEQFTWYATDAHGKSDLGEPPAPGVGGFMGSGSHSNMASHNPDPSAIFQIAPRPAECIATPSIFGHSFGSGGISAAHADGSVRHVSPLMSPMTFGRALCPADGQPLGPDWKED